LQLRRAAVAAAQDPASGDDALLASRAARLSSEVVYM
jgi:hypothetical protein